MKHEHPWNQWSTKVDATEALRRASTNVSGRKVFTTSFSKEDQIISYLIASQGLEISIATLDTGRHFEQTYLLHHQTEEWLGIKIETFFPDPENLQSLYADQGPNGFYHSTANREACCRIRKSLPLDEALRDAKLWITGLRADQSPFRKGMQMWEEVPSLGLTKFNPLFHWGDDQVDQWITQHNIPVNALHAEGYRSIGCAPCTRPIKPGEHPRAGRWWWEESKKECGLHLKKNNRL